jgi:hypothetical protein
MGDSSRNVGESALHLSRTRPPRNLFPSAPSATPIFLRFRASRLAQ